MPGVEAAGGPPGGDTTPPPPQGHDEDTRVEEEGALLGSDTEEEEEEGERRAPRGGSAPPQLLSDRIMLAAKLGLLFLALVIVVHSSKGPLIRKASSPQPFFPQHSLVTDFHSGDVGGLTERLLASDLSLVVYYAPWDRSSQALRWEVEQAAQFHHEQIYFAAINCWHPGSECKSRYKIRKFPAVVLHIRTSSGMETKAFAYGGPHEAGHLIRFLSRCLRPLTHVASHADLPRLQVDHSAVVLGYYDFSSSLVPRGYTSYYLAALRWLQHEPSGAVAWGVVTNPQVAQAFSLSTSQSIHLVLWNTTLSFTNAATSDSEGISNWVAKRLDETASWLHVSGDKSQVLSLDTQEGPSLLLFAPDNPYHTPNDPYTLLREISLDYFNCNQSSRVSTLARYLRVSRSRGRTFQRKVEKACQTYLTEHLQMLHLAQQQRASEGKGCCHSTEAGGVCVPAPDGSPSSEECVNPNLQMKANLLHHVNSLMTVLSDSCREMVLQYNPWKDPSVCCHHANTTKAKTKPIPHIPKDKTQPDQAAKTGQVDDHIERLEAVAGEEQCKKLFHGSLLGPVPYIRDQNTAVDITGLGCRTNKTLSFVALDSLQHRDVARRLGIDLSSREPANTAAVIVDVQREAHFILDASLSKHALAAFILNYTNGMLDRTLVSGGKEMTQCDSTSQMCIQELTAENYFKVTQEAGKTVVVLHYNSNCVACSTIGHVFLAVAHSMRHLPDVTFARINVVGNILPWHLHFTTLPTIIVHPALRKSDSRVFDLSHSITPASVISFIMADLSPRQRLTLALHACGEECREGVLHEAALASTALHHNLTTSTRRLQRVLERLVKAAPAADTPSEASAHEQRSFERLRQARVHFMRDIKTQRKKLEHLHHMLTLLSKPLDQEALDGLHVESFNHLLQTLTASSVSSPPTPPEEAASPDTARDES